MIVKLKNVSVNVKKLLELQGSQVNMVVRVSQGKILQAKAVHQANLVSLIKVTDQVVERHTKVTDQPDKVERLTRAIEITTDQVSKIEMLHQADLKKNLLRKKFKIKSRQHLLV